MDDLIVFGIPIPVDDVGLSYRPGLYGLGVKHRGFDVENLPKGEIIASETDSHRQKSGQH